MNILFVHEVDWLAKVVFDIHLLAEALALLGHRIFAIDYENTWKRDGFFDLGSLKTKEVDGVSRAFPGASVCLRRPGFIKVPGLSRLSAAGTHYFEIQKTIKGKNIDAIVLYSVPTNGLQAIYLARKSHIPIVFRSIDILHILVPYPVLGTITRALERRVYSRVDSVLPDTPQYAKYVARMGAPESRIKLLPFPVDTSLFHPSVDSYEIRRKWGLQDNDRVIVFIGTLFGFSGLDEFIPHFPRLIEEVPEARLLIVGDGPQRPRLEKIVAERGLGAKVTITGFEPYATMPQYINLASVCINPFLVSKDTMDIFPAKIMQYIACGKATVATPLRGITTLLPGESHGVVYADNAADMTREIISLLKSKERREKLGQAGWKHVKEEYSCEKIAHQLEEILLKKIKEKRNGASKQA